jgi:hypothetical protein
VASAQASRGNVVFEGVTSAHAQGREICSGSSASLAAATVGSRDLEGHESSMQIGVLWNRSTLPVVVGDRGAVSRCRIPFSRQIR